MCGCPPTPNPKKTLALDARALRDVERGAGIRCPEDVAVSTACGMLDAIVVESTEDAQAVIEFIRRQAWTPKQFRGDVCMCVHPVWGDVCVCVLVFSVFMRAQQTPLWRTVNHEIMKNFFVYPFFLVNDPSFGCMSNCQNQPGTVVQFRNWATTAKAIDPLQKW